MKRLILTIGMGLVILTTNAQTNSPELIGSAGDSFSNSNYQLDWSIGEIQTETYVGTGYVITQGFQQGTFIITTIEENRNSQYNISAFPNPTKDFINLKFENEENNSHEFVITDLTGKILQNGKLNSNNEEIDFSNYSIGTYFITISQNNQFVKSFKIIKN